MRYRLTGAILACCAACGEYADIAVLTQHQADQSTETKDAPPSAPVEAVFYTAPPCDGCLNAPPPETETADTKTAEPDTAAHAGR